MQSQAPTDEQLFFQALEVPETERDRFVVDSCAEDSERIERVRELLRSHDLNSADKHFLLDRPVVAACLPSASQVNIGEREGDRLGRYRLLEKIGEGGMGVVYMAEQTSDVRRRVALKIIKLGMDTRQVIARFEAERQAMALFDHPNIAKVLDVGATDSGRPYFVMELVKGTSLSGFVRKHELDLVDRLELFVQICNALQHAHQKGIIHRDLKPSNVLVTLYDGRPVPKVIDFGIAKAIGQQQLTDKTLFTRYSAMVGTPQYMSPEQAELTGIDVDTRSDVYSLGVLLYELVTGSTPIRSDELASMNPLKLFETLRDAEIETPSSRISRTLQDEEIPTEIASMAVAARRMKRELDWVILKALARDRTLRYASANGLAADVRRFIDGDPVMAAPPSKSRWFNAFYRKNRATVLASAVIGLVLIVSSIACFAFGVSALKANRKLNSVNQRLSENVVRLEAAEAQLRKEAEQRQYATAIEMAVIKFDAYFFEEIADSIFSEENELELEATAAADNDGGEDRNEPVFPESDFSLTCCTCYDPKYLLVFEDSDRLGNSVDQLREYFDTAEEESRQRFEAQFAASNTPFPFEFDDLDSDNSVHSPQCIRMREEIKAQIPFKRSRFFRVLVGEYRRSFGEDDPHVAEALILLAACLEEVGDVDGAESHVREAIVIGAEGEKQIARALLDRIKNKRRQLRIGN